MLPFIIILKEHGNGDNLMNQKVVFLQALIVTFIFFNLGIFFGYMLESDRINKINDFYSRSEMDLLDQRIQKEAFDIVSLDCNRAIQANIDFADKIFEEALLIQRFESANKLSKDVILQHKRFDMLRTLFWINSIKIKEKCNAKYHNVVYFYKFNEPTIEQKAKQAVFSNLLEELKQEKGSEIMLIPIAADNEIISIDLLVNRYSIENLPTILIDEKIKIEEVTSKEDIAKYLD